MEVPLNLAPATGQYLTRFLLVAAAVVGMGSAQGTGTVEGFVGFDTAYPPLSSIRVTKDHAVCGNAITDEEFLVDPERKGLANAVIYWELPEGEEREAEQPGMAVLAQSGCRYEPHIQVATAVNKVQVLNQDGILHNIHAYDSRGGTLFNFAQPAFKKSMERDLKATGVVNFKCDVHEWMNAYVLLLDNVQYAITDEQGRFRLEDIAAGPQEILIWHEGLGFTSKSVTVEPGKSVEMNLVIEGAS